MVGQDIDAIVVGLGVGGQMVATRLAEAGLSVLGIEQGLVGGECPYWGCVPSKMMIRASNLLAEARRVDGMAGWAEVHPDWTPVARRIREEATDNWDDRAAVAGLTGMGGRFVRGHGKLAGPDRVCVDEETFSAARGVVIGVGTAAGIPPIDGLAGTPYWTNREAIEAETLPSSLLVLGGGAVGLELAQAFARFGVRVSVVESANRLLPGEEPESSELVTRALAADGISAHTSVRVVEIGYAHGEFQAELGDGTSLHAEKLLVATGRRTELGELGLETVGLDPRAKFIAVDGRMRAGERLWAVGDVTEHGGFTHVATYQAEIVVRDILGEDGPPADYRAMSWVTFTDPEIGSVGLTERQARAAGLAVRVGIAQVPVSARGWIHKAGNSGFIKLIVDADRGVLVGATSTGPVGGEVLGALVVAVHAEVPVEKLKHMIYAYPTFHRAIGDALSALS